MKPPTSSMYALQSISVYLRPSSHDLIRRSTRHGQTPWDSTRSPTRVASTEAGHRLSQMMQPQRAASSTTKNTAIRAALLSVARATLFQILVSRPSMARMASSKQTGCFCPESSDRVHSPMAPTSTKPRTVDESYDNSSLRGSGMIVKLRDHGLAESIVRRCWSSRASTISNRNPASRAPRFEGVAHSHGWYPAAHHLAFVNFVWFCDVAMHTC
jgi:hypothetical protein